MKKVVFFILAALAVLAWGCTKEVEKAVEEEPADVPETPEIPDADEPMVTVEFNADFDKTKTTLDDNSVVWEAGDKIVLFPMKYHEEKEDTTWEKRNRLAAEAVVRYNRNAKTLRCSCNRR